MCIRDRLTLAVILLSWIFDVYGLSVLQPQTGEEIRVQDVYKRQERSRVGHYAVAGNGTDRFGSCFQHDVGSLGNGSCCIYNIVYQYYILVF